MLRDPISRRDFLRTSLSVVPALRSRLGPRDRFFDVCIVGSGFAGTFLGLRLVEHQVRTILVEAGPPLSPTDPPEGRADLFPVESSGDPGFHVDDTRTIGIGGTSRRWNGVATRLLPEDFQVRTVYGSGTDWPLVYDDLAPYYCQAESAMSVVGGGYQSGAEPPRLCPYRFERTTYTSPASLFPDHELRFFPLPFARREGERQALRLAEAEVPRFVASPWATLLSESPATKISTDRSGVATALEIRRADGSIEAIRARHFVVAAGTPESARLLLASRSAAAPAGLGNDHGLVGTHFTAHPRYRVEVPLQEGLPRVVGIHRSLSLSGPLRRRGCNAAHLDLHLRQSDAIVELMLEMEPASSNRFTSMPETTAPSDPPIARLQVNWTRRDRRTIERCAEIRRQLATTLAANAVALPSSSIAWFHPAGVCRMGKDPTSGVVDRDCRVFGTSNVYVVGSSIFPTSGSGNPTLTIVALALRLADHLISRLGVAGGGAGPAQ